MVRLNNISVLNFKNISHAEVDFKNFNVIVGPNGSGKSNFLRILPFLNFIINGANDEIQDFMHHGHNPLYGFVYPDNSLTDKNIKTSIKVIFSDWNDENVYNYHLELCKIQQVNRTNLPALAIFNESFTYKKRKQKGAAATLFSRTENTIKYNDEIKKLSAIDEVSSSTSALRVFNIILKKLPDPIKRGLEAFNTLIQSDILYLSNHYIKSYNSDESYSENRLVSFKLRKQIKFLLEGPLNEIYKKALEEVVGIIKIEFNRIVENSEGTIFFTQYGNTAQVLSELSDGTVLMIAIITRVFSTNCTTLIIEEPENSTHPKALQSLIAFLKSMSSEKQFLISTHSASILNMISPDEVIVCRLDESGMSTIAGVDNPKELRRKLNEGYISFGDLLYTNLEEY